MPENPLACYKTQLTNGSYGIWDVAEISVTVENCSEFVVDSIQINDTAKKDIDIQKELIDGIFKSET